ncbi:MAG TPA: BtrH N-terminal domain-containing protein [Solirubrobacteraceae bacterium]|jgi:hypothetical protein|nr:BtrH N-terminal domain-containing protein [Solirubrobacteraceae bacterium]
MASCAPASATVFCHRVAEHAASGAIRDVLEHARLSYAPEALSEGAVFGFSGALALSARISGSALPAIDLDGRTPSLERELLRHLGLAADWCTTDDPDEAWRLLRAELQAGRPTLVRADRAELDYRAGGRHDTLHAIVVTGLDAEAGIVWVADADFAQPQPCTLDALARARRSPAWPEPARHGMLRLRPGARLAHPRAAVAAALRRTVQNMRRPRRSEHMHIRCGLEAVDAVADSWERLPAMAGERLAQTLAALRFGICEGGSGGALYRSLQARFLHDAAALLGSEPLTRAALACDDLADAWRALGGSLACEDVAIAHESARPWLGRIQALERRHVELVEQHLSESRASVA